VGDRDWIDALLSVPVMDDEAAGLLRVATTERDEAFAALAATERERDEALLEISRLTGINAAGRMLHEALAAR